MLKSTLVWISVVLIFALSTLHYATIANAQSQSKLKEPLKIKSNENSSVSVSAIVKVQITNETFKAKDGILKSAVGGLLNSGANILKTPGSVDPVTKSKIVNLINNVTQNVQGTEATNAIIGVEISKALKTANMTSDKPHQTAIVTVESLSNCKPSTANMISCENTVTIK